MPSCRKRCATSGFFTAFATSAASRETIAGGVPAGASRPISGAKSKPGTPSSAMVGTSGACGERRGTLIASSFTLPAFTCASIAGSAEKSIDTWPPRSAGTACPMPLNGTCTMSRPSAAFIASVVRWWMLPRPEEP